LRAIAALTTGLSLLCPALASAEALSPAVGGARTPPPMNLAPPDLPWGRVVWGTLVVVGLICLGVYLLKRVGGGALSGRGRYMEVLEVRPVMRGVNLFLVRVAGRVVLFGSTGQQVTQLSEFAEGELPTVVAPVRPVGLEGFRALLSKLGGAQQ
jgi:flagellar biogenesis protein FliO